MSGRTTAIVVHGGAWSIPPEAREAHAAGCLAAAERGFAVLDLRGHFLGHGYHAEDPTVPSYDPEDPTLWFAPDCIHPNDRGHHEVRRLFHAAITGEDFTYRLP